MAISLPDYILFIVGLSLLLGSAELLVRNAVKVASLIGKSSLFIGLTFTAFGTSAPELAVGISGQLNHTSDLGVGNVIGSNIFNIFFVLGLAALVRPIVVSRPVIWRDVPILLAVSILFYLFALNGTVGLSESLILVGALAFYLYYLVRNSSTRPDLSFKSLPESTPRGIGGRLPAVLGLIAGSIAVLALGAHLVVTGAAGIAESFGMSRLTSGLTIVAVGTSLPEIATTVAAVRNNEHELAIGNVMGSCFFNIVAVPATMALVGTAGLSIGSDALIVDIPVMLLALIACLPIFFSGHRISRSEGVLFLAYYGVYAVLLYTRNARTFPLDHRYTEVLLLAFAVVSITSVVVVLRAVRYYKSTRKETGV